MRELKVGLFVHFRSHGAERTGEILAVHNRQAKIKWMVGTSPIPREKWVPTHVIYRKVMAKDEHVPRRTAPFYCLDEEHVHAAEYERDECVRKARGA